MCASYMPPRENNRNMVAVHSLLHMHVVHVEHVRTTVCTLEKSLLYFGTTHYDILARPLLLAVVQ